MSARDYRVHRRSSQQLATSPTGKITATPHFLDDDRAHQARTFGVFGRASTATAPAVTTPAQTPNARAYPEVGAPVWAAARVVSAARPSEPPI
ncbi:hypothetical protein ACFQX6_12235 [Streptosporangium lutulentum]